MQTLGYGELLNDRYLGNSVTDAALYVGRDNAAVSFHPSYDRTQREKKKNIDGSQLLYTQ